MGVSNRFAKAVKAKCVTAAITKAKKKTTSKKAIKAMKATPAAAPRAARAPYIKGAESLKGQVIASRATNRASRALGVATAALYVKTSSELKGSKETPRGATPASLITPTAAALTVAISGASGATIMAAGISVSLITF
ncbi:hypothetical protein ACEPPN_004960 [Leptodophora sp. 'Broadleaf-Isolate-01']